MEEVGLSVQVYDQETLTYGIYLKIQKTRVTLWNRKARLDFARKPAQFRYKILWTDLTMIMKQRWEYEKGTEGQMILSYHIMWQTW